MKTPVNDGETGKKSWPSGEEKKFARQKAGRKKEKAGKGLKIAYRFLLIFFYLSSAETPPG